MTIKRPETRSQAMAVLESEPARNFIIYPQVYETTHRGERTWDIFSRLLKDRIVFLGSDVERRRRQHHHRPVPLPRERGPGQGHPALHQQPRRLGHRGPGIYDTMQYVRCPVSTICIGQAASMGAVLLAAGTKGPALRAAPTPAS